ASAFQSRPKRTVARRPSVSTSSRNVVTSKPRPSITTVTVPWSMPVGTALKPAASTRPITAGGSAVVATSNSLASRPSSASPTPPPAAPPPRARGGAPGRPPAPAGSFGPGGRGRGGPPPPPTPVGGVSLFFPRHTPPFLDVRGNVGPPRGPPAELRHDDEASR